MSDLAAELAALARRVRAGEAVVAGVLSGTSADGIDVGLVRFRPSEVFPDARAPESDEASAYGAPESDEASAYGAPELRAFRCCPYPPDLHARVTHLIETGEGGARELALLSRDLGRAFGAAARALADETDLSLALVGSHGQTVWHHDGDEASGPASLQLGDGDAVAEAAGCAVVSDFRQRDLAAGGEGAPISALVDDELFAARPRPLLVLNLGGISNLTYLEPGRPPLGFDAGPAGCLLDALARRWLDRPFDAGGEAAAAGRPREALVAAWLDDPFYRRPIPKSTGRDHFGLRWIEERLARTGQSSSSAKGAVSPTGAETGADEGAGVTAGSAIPIPDLLASAAEAVARAVARGVSEHLPATPAECLVGGGGVHHGPLMAALGRLLPCPVRSLGEAGLDPDAREAVCFALLAARFLFARPLDARLATGARPGRLYGKLSPAPPPADASKGGERR